MGTRCTISMLEIIVGCKISVLFWIGTFSLSDPGRFVLTLGTILPKVFLTVISKFLCHLSPFC